MARADQPLSLDRRHAVDRMLDADLLDRVCLGDCLHYMRGLPDGIADLVVSSPPYGIGKTYEDRRELRAYLEDQQWVLAQCARVLRDGGSIFWQVGTHTASDGSVIPLDVRVFPMLEDLGLRPRGRIAWVRQHGLHAERRFSGRHETILWFSKGQDYHFDLDAIRVPQKYQNKKAWKGDRKGELTCNPDGKNPGDVWAFANVKHNHEEQTIHPCQFPEAFVARIVRACSPVGGVVLDPYMGTFTTAVVARDEKRHFLGSELDAQYHAIGQCRLSGLPDADGVFPNLKTLRAYAAREGVDAATLTFALQRPGRTARVGTSMRTEGEQLAEMQRRLAVEEDAFAARRGA